MAAAPGSLPHNRQCARLVGTVAPLAAIAVSAALACAPAPRPQAVSPLADPAVPCTEWRVEVLNHTEERVYVYHVWAREDILGTVEPGQLGQFTVDSQTRPDIRMKLGHSWYPWAQREHVRILVVCSERPRPNLRRS